MCEPFCISHDAVKAVTVKDEKDQYISYCFRETMKQLGSLPEGKGLVDNKAIQKPAETSYGPTDKKLSKADKKLYDLGKDIGETRNLAAEQPERVAEMKALLEKLIADGLRNGNFVKNPQVTIVVMQVRGNQASVLGQVNRPGRYPIEVADMRLTDLLAMAGGTAEIGRAHV